MVMMMNSGHLFWTQTELVSQPINWIIMRTHAKKREKDGVHTELKVHIVSKNTISKKSHLIVYLNLLKKHVNEL